MSESSMLTVVVPAYNVEKFLSQCLDSLVNQSVRNYQVIIVNDGSTDSTGEIAQKYALKYPDLITYIEQENRGLGAARNVGMSNATTPYITFLDSDDWLVPRYVEIFMERIKQEPEKPDLIFTLPIIFNMATQCFEQWMDEPLFTTLFGEKGTVLNAREEPRLYGLEPNACRRIYSLDFLREHDFSFPEGTKWEDVEPHFQLLHVARRCIGEGQIGFVYRINSGNQITASGGMDRLQVISVFARALSFAIENHWDGIEISYIISMMRSFVDWSIECASVCVRKKLVPAVHELYYRIPDELFKNYYGDIHPSKKERLTIMLLRSPFYNIVSNEHDYRFARSICKRFIKQ